MFRNAHAMFEALENPYINQCLVAMIRSIGILSYYDQAKLGKVIIREIVDQSIETGWLTAMALLLSLIIPILPDGLMRYVVHDSLNQLIDPNSSSSYVVVAPFSPTEFKLLENRCILTKSSTTGTINQSLYGLLIHNKKQLQFQDKCSWTKADSFCFLIQIILIYHSACLRERNIDCDFVEGVGRKASPFTNEKESFLVQVIPIEDQNGNQLVQFIAWVLMLRISGRFCVETEQSVLWTMYLLVHLIHGSDQNVSSLIGWNPEHTKSAVEIRYDIRRLRISSLNLSLDYSKRFKNLGFRISDEGVDLITWCVDLLKLAFFEDHFNSIFTQSILTGILDLLGIHQVILDDPVICRSVASVLTLSVEYQGLIALDAVLRFILNSAKNKEDLKSISLILDATMTGDLFNTDVNFCVHEAIKHFQHSHIPVVFQKSWVRNPDRKVIETIWHACIAPLKQDLSITQKNQDFQYLDVDLIQSIRVNGCKILGYSGQVAHQLCDSVCVLPQNNSNDKFEHLDMEICLVHDRPVKLRLYNIALHGLEMVINTFRKPDFSRLVAAIVWCLNGCKELLGERICECVEVNQRTIMKMLVFLSITVCRISKDETFSEAANQITLLHNFWKIFEKIALNDETSFARLNL